MLFFAEPMVYFSSRDWTVVSRPSRFMLSLYVSSEDAHFPRRFYSQSHLVGTNAKDCDYDVVTNDQSFILPSA